MPLGMVLLFLSSSSTTSSHPLSLYQKPNTEKGKKKSPINIHFSCFNFYLSGNSAAYSIYIADMIWTEILILLNYMEDHL